MKAMLLAAGCGERMQTLTKDCPKPLLKIGDHALIEYHLHALSKVRVKEIMINLHYLGNKISEKLGDGSRYGVAIHYSHETEELLGTANGIRKVLPWFEDKPFLLISADIWTDYPWQNVLSMPVDVAHLILTSNPDYHLSGDYSLEDGYVGFGSPKFTYASMGILHPRALDYAPHSKQLSAVFSQAILERKITGEVYSGRWFNVGTPEELEKAREVLLSRV